MNSFCQERELRAPLYVDGAEIRLVRLPLVTPFTISSGTLNEKVFPLITLKSAGLEGYGEGVMDPLPDYLEETVSGAVELIRSLWLPKIVGQRFENPQALNHLLQPWRGNHMAKATLEMAFWDLWAKSLDLPLKTILGGTGERVDVGVSLGIAPIAETLERVAAHNDQGYRRIKLKIKPGHDLDLVRAVRTSFPDIHLTADANCAYTLADSNLLTQLDAYDLDYIEQPLAWNDIHDHAILQSRLRTPICLDESIRGPEDARKALQSDGARVVNIKVGRCGGYFNALQIHDLCAAFSVPVWCGGMLESGVGRAHNIHLSTLANFSKPGDTSSSSRYFHRDLVEQKLEATNGQMAVPDGPGIGVTLDRDFLESVTLSCESMTA